MAFKFSTILMSLSFNKSRTDHTLFLKKVEEMFVAVLVYVDDIFIASNNDEDVAQLKEDLDKSLKLRDLGPLKYFLGLKRSSSCISVFQRKYVLELIEEVGLLACKSSSIPMEPSDKPLLEDATSYRRLVAKLMCLTITHPNITYSLNKHFQFALVQEFSSSKSL